MIWKWLKMMKIDQFGQAPGSSSYDIRSPRSHAPILKSGTRRWQHRSSGNGRENLKHGDHRQVQHQSQNTCKRLRTRGNGVRTNIGAKSIKRQLRWRCSKNTHRSVHAKNRFDNKGQKDGKHLQWWKHPPKPPQYLFDDFLLQPESKTCKNHHARQSPKEKFHKFNYYHCYCDSCCPSSCSSNVVKVKRNFFQSWL